MMSSTVQRIGQRISRVWKFFNIIEKDDRLLSLYRRISGILRRTGNLWQHVVPKASIGFLWISNAVLEDRPTVAQQELFPCVDDANQSTFQKKVGCTLVNIHVNIHVLVCTCIPLDVCVYIYYK